MSNPTANRFPHAEERLSQLIRLKRAERPDEAFWEDFGRRLQSRQLTTLVRIQPWYLRLGRVCLFAARKAAAPTAAVGAIAVTAVVVTQHSFQASNEGEQTLDRTTAPIAEATVAPPVFVVESSSEQLMLPDEQETAGPKLSRELPATYQIPVMVRPQSSASFELRSAPKSLTRPSAGAQRHGALIISTEPQP